MDNTDLPKILIVSGACCSPGLGRLDQILEINLQQALRESGMALSSVKVSLSSIIHGGGDLNPVQRERIMALFQAYGARFTPAMLINDDVCFAGKPPTSEQIKQVLAAVNTPNTE